MQALAVRRASVRRDVHELLRSLSQRRRDRDRSRAVQADKRRLDEYAATHRSYAPDGSGATYLHLNFPVWYGPIAPDSVEVICPLCGDVGPGAEPRTEALRRLRGPYRRYGDACAALVEHVSALHDPRRRPAETNALSGGHRA